MFKKLAIALLLAFTLLAAVVLYNTFTFKSVQTKVTAYPAPVLKDTTLSHFKQALAFKTISYADADLLDTAAFLGFRNFLETTYPLVHQHLQREIIAKYTLLYTWKGKNPALAPIVLMAHMDVVPIEEATKTQWTVYPFGGVVKDGFIWGRGTTDDKINLISILEATEKLLQQGHQPERTVYLSFGHDEEIGGKGAIAVAALLEARGVHADLVLDEGGIITKEKVPGITHPVALLGTSEKGYMSLIIKAKKAGGHSSMPEAATSIDILSKALVQLRSQPFDVRFSAPMEGLIRYLGPEMPFFQKMAFANRWLFSSIIIKNYEETGAGNAMLRTTMVPTILQAGIKDNVVPFEAAATVNFRLLPGDSGAAIIEKVKSIINDNRVSVELYKGAYAEPSTISSIDGYGFKKVQHIIRQTYPNVLVSPFLMIGASDSRHFGKVSTNIIKFSPMIDPIAFHGIDERLSLESFSTCLWFYEQLLKDLH